MRYLASEANFSSPWSAGKWRVKLGGRSYITQVGQTFSLSSVLGGIGIYLPLKAALTFVLLPVLYLIEGLNHDLDGHLGLCSHAYSNLTAIPKSTLPKVDFFYT
jgi:hypothetical protein